MNNAKKSLLGKIHPAIIAVWAAIIAVGHILPTFPLLGTGSTFSLTGALTPLSGVFFGPVAGALCAALGGFIGNLAAPHTAWMGMGTFIIGTVSAFTSGCIAWGKWPPVGINRNGGVIINGGIIVYFFGTVLWFSQEIGRSVPLLPAIYYGLGFATLIAGNAFAPKMFGTVGKACIALKFPAVWLCAFGGSIGGASIGNFFSIILYRLPKELWLTLMVQAPVERAIFAAGAMLIGTPLLEALPKIGVFVGPDAAIDEEF